MQFNLLTFLFELINFLLFVWLLRKLLYKPVIQVLSDRRKFIQERFDAARQKEAELEKLRLEYQQLLAKMTQEREQTLSRLRGEMELEKSRLKRDLQIELDQEKQRAHSFIENEKHSLNLEIQSEAIQAALNYALRFILHHRDLQLEQKLVKLALDAAKSLFEIEGEEIERELQQRGEIPVEMAFHADHSLIPELIQGLKQIFGENYSLDLRTKPDLEAGVRIYLGSRLIDASLQGQLEDWRQELKQHVQN